MVTSALPYANGPLHVGHAIGAYLPADVYVRYLRASGHDVVFICGTDEHGTPITVTAEQEGVSPQKVVDKYHDMQLKAFHDLGVEFDNFSGTAREIHHKLSQEFFLKVLKAGFIKEKTVERPYCPNCKRFLPDRYVRGTCPSCESEDERGDQCEKCGKQLEPHELVKPYCSICRSTPEMRETRHWFFKLSEFGEKLKKWIEEKNDHWPPNARNFALGWIKEGLQDRAITRDLKWGIPVPEKDLDGNPIDGREGKVLYVWFDAPIGYISSTREWAEKNKKGDAWKKYWDKESWRKGELKIVHFIGKDNIPFHTIIWPAVLMAEGSYALPWQIASNEYLNLEGRKMSTSRGWVLWLHDILNEFDPDVIRYYLLSINPDKSDSDFSFDEMRERVNNELIATLGNFINRTLSFVKSKKEGVVPEYDVGKEVLDSIMSNGGKIPKERLLTHPSDSGISPDILGRIRDVHEVVGDRIGDFNFKLALSRLLQQAQYGNQFFDKNRPWEKDNGTTLFLCVNLCRSLAIAMAPFLPHSAERLWKMLNLESSVHDQKWESAGELGIKPGHRISKVNVLYNKIYPEKIDEVKKKILGVSKKEGEVKEMVDYTEFSKIDLRVGVIKEVENHPNADKLYLLKIDTGDNVIQSVAGLKEGYSKEELVGKRVAVVCNLKPVKIRGVESQGMLLAACGGEGGTPVLLVPEKEVDAGCGIR